MKPFLFLFISLLTVNCLSGQALDKYGRVTNNAADHVNQNGATGISGLNKNGARVTSPITTSIFHALDFDGVDDYVSLPSGVYFNGDFTIECWVYPRAFANWERIIDFGNGAGSNNVLLGYTYGNSGAPGFYVEGAQMAANQTIPLNEWTHIAATLSGSAATIYINGVAAGASTLRIPANVIRNYCYIGKSNWGDPNANAVFDELRIWNTAKTESEILASMDKELSGNEAGLVTYFNFNQGIPGGNNAGINTVTDRTANANNGALNGFAKNGITSNWVAGAPLLFDGSSPETASSSAYAIKQSYPASTDGLYWIKNPDINGGAPFRIYADMTTDGGGWTLIMSNVDNNGWGYENAVSLNANTPGIGANYSIIEFADRIKRSSSGFQYMIDAHTRNSNGGIWTANGAYSFLNGDNSQTDVTLDVKFGTWEYSDAGIEQRMPWYANCSGFITTSGDCGGGSWWGTLVSTGGWTPAPWIAAGCGTEGCAPNPERIWYWVR